MGMSSSRSSASQTTLTPNITVKKSEEEWRACLTPKQFAVLRRGATDPRGSGEYDSHYPTEPGVYVCAGCSAPLYEGKHKFDCGCGWPGFWSCIAQAVYERVDADGSRRVEILCNACGGHLGHVFRGEGFSNPPPNERHCVNSTSIKWVPTSKSTNSGVAGAPSKFQ
jgi:peptide-methionine (R)-S-oxide reductase